MIEVCFGCADISRPETHSARKGVLPRHQSRCLALCFLLVGFVAGSGRVYAASLDEAAERYRPYMIEGIGQALGGVRDLRERLAAGDLTGARKAWISARAGWERSEVFTAGFVPELDEKIDAWPDATVGFHAIEAKLFGANRVDARTETEALVGHLSDLHVKLRDMPLTPQGLLNGTVRLAYEVGESKSDGGESQISGTSLDDMRNNVAGIQLAFRTIFVAAIEAVDRKLAETIAAKIEQLSDLLVVRDLQHVDIPRLRRASEELVVMLQGAAPKVGLGRPTLEASR
jgi:iron uptake system component EfeO